MQWKKKRKKEEEKSLHVFKGLNQWLGNVEIFFHIYLSDLSGSKDPLCDVNFRTVVVWEDLVRRCQGFLVR